MDKNKKFVEFLRTCPTIKANPLFFNFGNVENNAAQLNIQSDDRALHKPYIDGSVSMRYTCSVDCFKSIACIPVVAGSSDENMDDLAEVQSVLDWVHEQGELRNFPNFGSDCVIDKMETLTTKPALINVQSNLNPPVAIYRIMIQIDYIDNHNKLWN